MFLKYFFLTVITRKSWNDFKPIIIVMNTSAQKDITANVFFICILEITWFYIFTLIIELRISYQSVRFDIKR